MAKKMTFEVGFNYGGTEDLIQVRAISAFEAARKVDWMYPEGEVEITSIEVVNI